MVIVGKLNVIDCTYCVNEVVFNVYLIFIVSM